jgi:hypothetical protein
MHGNDMARKPFVDTIPREVLGKQAGKAEATDSARLSHLFAIDRNSVAQ